MSTSSVSISSSEISSICTRIQASNSQSVPGNSINSENLARSGFDLEHCLKILRHLELSGHIKKNFRQKFLTWYSLRATAQEENVVEIFINGFKDDSVALADQLVDTFSDCISRKRSAIGGGDGGRVN